MESGFSRFGIVNASRAYIFEARSTFLSEAGTPYLGEYFTITIAKRVFSGHD
jgi:hypothetical protein